MVGEAVEEWLMPSLCRGMGWYDPPCLLQNDVFDVSLFFVCCRNGDS